MKIKYIAPLLIAGFTLSAYALNDSINPTGKGGSGGEPTFCETKENGQRICVCFNGNCSLNSEDTDAGYGPGERDYMLCVNSVCDISTNGWIDCIGSECTAKSSNAVIDCISGSECHTTQGISNASLLCEPGQAGKGSQTGKNTCVAANKEDTIYCQRGEDCNYYPTDHRNVRHTKGIMASMLKAFDQEHATSKQWAEDQISKLESKLPRNIASDLSSARQQIHEFRTGSLTGCYGPYALCAYTDCKKVTIDGKEVAECSCPVNFGVNYGSIACEQRNGVYDETKNTNKPIVVSDYSAINFAKAPSNAQHQAASAKLFDPAKICHIQGEYQYADCFDVKCVVSEDGKTADCTCPMTTANGPGFLMEAKNCEEASAICENFGSSSSDVVANSAPVAFGTKVVNNALELYGEHISPDILCTPSDA